MILGHIALWLALLAPLLLGASFRVGTSHIFFGLMAGELLGRYFGHDLEALLRIGEHYAGTGEAIFIVVPMVITAYLMRGDISHRRLVIHVVPLLVTGIVCAAFVLPILPEAIQDAVRTVPFGDTLLSLHRAIVGSMIVLQLVWLWVMHGKRGRRHGAHAA